MFFLGMSWSIFFLSSQADLIAFHAANTNTNLMQCFSLSIYFYFDLKAVFCNENKIALQKKDTV